MTMRAYPVVSTLVAVLLVATWAWGADQSAEPKVRVGDDTFECITEMTPVRHFYVDNLLGNLQGTGRCGEGQRRLPRRIVVQLVPTEVMIKQQKGIQSHDPGLGILCD